MDLAKSTFIVTGGASGLGAGTVRTLAAGGANVVMPICPGGQGGARQAWREGAVREVRCHERGGRKP
jgi:NAD(P)-dependent dehydrogenase (short-subunit alcohol dehydrogenase family)